MKFQEVSDQAKALRGTRHAHVAPERLTAELTALADKRVVALTKYGEWTADPYVDHVWAVVIDGRAALVYYRAEADFEVDEEMLANVRADGAYDPAPRILNRPFGW